MHSLSENKMEQKLTLFVVFGVLVNVDSKGSAGHLKPLGSHMDPLGVTMNGKFSSPTVFYEFFVKESQPLLMKSPLFDTPFPAFEKWTDEFMRDEYGSELVSVEKSKKERRGVKPLKMTLHEFLDIYSTQKVYMVTPLPAPMKNDVHVPVTLQCGGFQQVLQEVVLWMSGGGTKSVLHNDKLDNLLCLLEGTKDVLLIDKAYKSDVEADGFVQEGTYSEVDVDSVDLRLFPRLGDVPWHRAHLTAGDCLFIPFRWYHQINSSSIPGERNLAVNYWFSHLWWHNGSDCRHFQTFNVTEPLTNFPFASTNEQIRSQVLEAFSDLDEVTREEFVSPFNAGREQAEELFSLINKDGTDILSWDELYRFNIDDAVNKFPELFAAGVTVPENIGKKKSRIETVHVKDLKPEEENVVEVPMIEPTTEELEKLLADLALQDEELLVKNEQDSRSESAPNIQGVNVKVTKNKQNDMNMNKNEDLKNIDKEKLKDKENEKPKHDEF